MAKTIAFHLQKGGVGKTTTAINLSSALASYGKKVLLIDDIYTTGATFDSCAHVLKRAGAEKVYGASLCIGRGM